MGAGNFLRSSCLLLMCSCTSLLSDLASSLTDDDVARLHTDQLLRLSQRAAASRAHGAFRGGERRLESASHGRRLAPLDDLQQRTHLIYSHPLSGAELVSAYTTIAWRVGEALQEDSIYGKLTVTGQVSGSHDEGETLLLRDGATFMFVPATPFEPGEGVIVTVAAGVQTISGRSLPEATWGFLVSYRPLDTYFDSVFPFGRPDWSTNTTNTTENNNSRGLREATPPKVIEAIRQMQEGFLLTGGSPPASNTTFVTRRQLQHDGPAPATGRMLQSHEQQYVFPDQRYRTLPDGFPSGTLTIHSNKSQLAPGYVWTSQFTNDNYGKLNIMMTDHGDPVFFDVSRVMSYFAPTGDGTQSIMAVYDSFMTLAAFGEDYEETERTSTQHGHIANQHDYMILENGNGMLFIYDPQQLDLTRLRPELLGASSSTWAVGLVLQEVTPEGYCVFEWRMWDHLPSSWQDTEIPVRENIWDIAHANSVDEGPDGNFLVSLRALNEVIKIDRTTGAVLWRLGGKRSSFEIVGDPNGQFAAQHDARDLGGDIITLFDNAVRTGDTHARAMDYALEFDGDGTPTVARVESMWDSGMRAYAKGSYRRLDNGNRAVCLGFDVPDKFNPNDQEIQEENVVGNPFYAETSPSGSWLVSLRWDGPYHSYRSVKAPWTGRPTWQPVALLDNDNGDGLLQLHFSWNGATNVAKWRVMQGPVADDVSEHLETVIKTRFEHWVAVDAGRSQCLFFQVVALADDDSVMAYSSVVTSPACT